MVLNTNNIHTNCRAFALPRAFQDGCCVSWVGMEKQHLRSGGEAEEPTDVCLHAREGQWADRDWRRGEGGCLSSTDRNDSSVGHRCFPFRNLVVCSFMSLAGPWEPERDDDEETADPPNTSTARRYDIDPADPTRRVVHKKINSAYLKHQRWKEKQQQQQQQDEQRLASMSNATGVTSGGDATAARQRGNGRAAAAAAAPSSNGPAKHAKDGTPVARRTLTFVVGKWLLVTLLLAVGAGQFIAGDLLWGYRGRYTKIETYVPVSATGAWNV